MNYFEESPINDFLVFNRTQSEIISGKVIKKYFIFMAEVKQFYFLFSLLDNQLSPDHMKDNFEKMKIQV